LSQNCHYCPTFHSFHETLTRRKTQRFLTHLKILKNRYFLMNLSFRFPPPRLLRPRFRWSLMFRQRLYLMSLNCPKTRLLPKSLMSRWCHIPMILSFPNCLSYQMSHGFHQRHLSLSFHLCRKFRKIPRYRMNLLLSRLFLKCRSSLKFHWFRGSQQRLQ
jgi:hypothetical protein